MPVLEENLGIKEDQASSTGPGCWGGGLGRDAGGGWESTRRGSHTNEDTLQPLRFSLRSLDLRDQP